MRKTIERLRKEVVKWLLPEIDAKIRSIYGILQEHQERITLVEDVQNGSAIKVTVQRPFTRKRQTEEDLQRLGLE